MHFSWYCWISSALGLAAIGIAIRNLIWVNREVAHLRAITKAYEDLCARLQEFV